MCSLGNLYGCTMTAERSKENIANLYPRLLREVVCSLTDAVADTAFLPQLKMAQYGYRLRLKSPSQVYLVTSQTLQLANVPMPP